MLSATPDLDRLLIGFACQERRADCGVCKTMKRRRPKGNGSARQGRVEGFPRRQACRVDRDKGNSAISFVARTMHAGWLRPARPMGFRPFISPQPSGTMFVPPAAPGCDRYRIRAGEGPGRDGEFRASSLSPFIDLREGDLRETLKRIDGPVDLMLVDIWIAMARPALELVTPRLRWGAIVVCDNTERYRSEYADYFAILGRQRVPHDDAAVQRRAGVVRAMLTSSGTPTAGAAIGAAASEPALGDCAVNDYRTGSRPFGREIPVSLPRMYRRQ